jgi:predicted Zn-dependent peptidase
MQQVYRKQIMPKVHLTCVTTDKFKTGNYTVNFVSPLDKYTAALNAVLPRILRRGTSRLPDMGSLAAELDELYGARIEPIVRKKGERQLVGFAADFVDDAFVPEKDVLERVIGLTGEIMMSPSTSGGRLRAEFVDSERDKLTDEIRSLINDKRRYAETRLIEKMCDGEAYSVPYLGTESEAEKITVYTATKQYRELLALSDVEIFYCGSAPFERVELASLNAFSTLPRTDLAAKSGTVVLLEPKGTELREFSDSLDVTQGKLAIGCRMGQAMAYPNYAAISVTNAVFGGCVTSKLFLNVREKLSLCYYAGSVVDRHKGIMLISSGIDLDKYDEALSEIKRQLDAVKSGDILEWELDGAKRALITSLKTTGDSARRMEEFYIDGVLLGLEYTPDDMAALVSLVKAEDVVRTAFGIKMDAAYFLKGGANGEG